MLIGVYDADGKLLGIEWMTEREMYQSIPPVYTEYLGLQMMAWLQSQT